MRKCSTGLLFVLGMLLLSLTTAMAADGTTLPDVPGGKEMPDPETAVSMPDPSMPPVQKESVEGTAENPIVNQIKVVGGFTPPDEIKAKMGTREGTPLNRKVLEEDFQRLYRLGRYADVQIKQEPIPGEYKVNIIVLLREKNVIKRISFRGNKDYNPDKLLKLIKSKVGERYDEGQVARDARAIEQEYKDDLYYFSKVTPEAEPFEEGVKLIFDIQEGGQLWVRKIIFRGNYRFTDQTLRNTMKTRQTSFFTRGQLHRKDFQQDLERIKLFYQSNGYLDVTVTERPFQITSKEPDEGWFGRREAYIYIDIDEGEQYRVGAVNFDGNKLVSDQDIRGVIKTMPGLIFSPLTMSEDAMTIRDIYGSYPSSRYFTVVVPERILTEQPRVVDVTFHINESDQVRVEEVQIVGNTKTKDYVIRREVELYPGELIDTEKIKNSQRNLKNLNYFKEDTLTLEPREGSAPDRAKVIVDVEEAETGKISFGIGVSSADPIAGSVTLEQRNFDYSDMPETFKDFITGKAFTGGGQYFDINGSMGTKTFSTGFDFNNPWIFNRPISWGFGAYWKGYEWDEYDDKRLGLYTSIGHKLWNPNLRGSLTYRLEDVIMDDISASASPWIQREDGSKILSSVSPSINWDSRDNIFDPEKGVLAGTTYKFYGVGGDYDFWNWSLKGQLFYPFYTDKKDRNWYVMMRTDYATTDVWGDSDHVPVYERLYAGGIGSVRGWRNNTLGVSQDGSFVGGLSRQTNSIEVFMPVYERLIKASACFDAGGGFPDVWSISGGNVDGPNGGSGYRCSVGFGLHVKTPLSPMPIRIYFPIPLNAGTDDSTEFVQFTFGAIF